jgi:hypothetical protein
MPDEFGIKVSKYGEDVTTTAEKNLSLYTKYPLHKIKTEGESSLDVEELAIDGYKTITHDLGYKPFVYVFIQNDVGSTKRHQVRGRDPFGLPAVDGYEPRFSLLIGDNDFTVIVEFPDNVPDARSYDFYYYYTHEDTGL